MRDARSGSVVSRVTVRSFGTTVPVRSHHEFRSARGAVNVEMPPESPFTLSSPEGFLNRTMSRSRTLSKHGEAALPPRYRAMSSRIDASMRLRQRQRPPPDERKMCLHVFRSRSQAENGRWRTTGCGREHTFDDGIVRQVPRALPTAVARRTALAIIVP